MEHLHLHLEWQGWHHQNHLVHLMIFMANQIYLRIVGEIGRVHVLEVIKLILSHLALVKKLLHNAVSQRISK